MKEIVDFLAEATAWYNLPFTILFGLCLIFWVLRMTFLVLGGLIGLEADLDLDFNANGAGGYDASNAGGFLGHLARPIGADDAPFTVVFTLFTGATWVGSMVLNHFLFPGASVLVSVGLLLAAMLLAIAFARLVAMMIGRFLRWVYGMRKPQDVSLIGQMGSVISSEVVKNFGQIEVLRDSGPIKLNVSLAPGSERMVKGDRAKITDTLAGRTVYVVEKVDADVARPAGEEPRNA